MNLSSHQLKKILLYFVVIGTLAFVQTRGCITCGEKPPEPNELISCEIDEMSDVTQPPNSSMFNRELEKVGRELDQYYDESATELQDPLEAISSGDEGYGNQDDACFVYLDNHRTKVAGNIKQTYLCAVHNIIFIPTDRKLEGISYWNGDINVLNEAVSGIAITYINFKVDSLAEANSWTEADKNWFWEFLHRLVVAHEMGHQFSLEHHIDPLNTIHCIMSDPIILYDDTVFCSNCQSILQDFYP